MQKERNKFVVRIILLIGSYLVLLIANIDTMKILAEGNVSGIDSLKELILGKRESFEENSSKKEREDENLSDEDKNTEENQPLEEDSDEASGEMETFDTSNNFYTKSSNLKIYSDADIESETVDTLSRRVRVIQEDELDIITQEDIEVKDEEGNVTIEQEDIITQWKKVKYKKNQEEIEGWILADDVTDNYHELLPDTWKDLDFTHIPKTNYKNNPRIKAKGIYVSGPSAGLTSRVDNLIALSKRTGINAFVIDVKNDDGHLLFNMEFAEEYSDSPNKYNQIKDIEAFMEKLKENNIYTIARIVSFKDSAYARKNPEKAIFNKRTNSPYTDRDKVVWISPHDRDIWEYNIKVSQEAARVGFNEIQFDYVRFPATGGGRADANIDYRNSQNESKPVAIQQYLKYAREHLEPLEVYIAADVYGQVGSVLDDMNIGQYWESVSNAVDYICPMIYPSHYNPGVYGVAIPDADPYNTVYRCVRDEINRNENIADPSLIRPWLQAFTARWVKGHIRYGYDQIQDQIKALEDLGIEEYILWSPTNIYSMIEKDPPNEEAKENEKDEVGEEEKEVEEEQEKEEHENEEPENEDENENVAVNMDGKLENVQEVVIIEIRREGD